MKIPALTAAAVVVAGLGLAPAAAAPPLAAEPGAAPTAAATSVRYLYMVKGLGRSGDIYTGQIAVIRKSGGKVRGAQGALYSEARCLRGHVDNGWLVGRYPAYNYGGEIIPEAPLNVRWRGTGDRQHMAGWDSITQRRMSRISGGGVHRSIIAMVC